MFSCEFCEISKNTFFREQLLLRDFIFQTFSINDFIPPTIKDHNIKCICSKCFKDGITKSWIYYQFAARTVVKNLPANKQKHVNDLARKELVDFKKKQRRSNYFCSKLFLANISFMFSILNTLNGSLDWYDERLCFTLFRDVPILYPLKLSK